MVHVCGIKIGLCANGKSARPDGGEDSTSSLPTIQPKFVYLAGIPLAPGKSFKHLSNSAFPKRLQDEQAYWMR